MRITGKEVQIMQILLILAAVIIVVLAVITIADVFVIGVLRPKLSRECAADRFVIEKPNRIDTQPTTECSAFSSAYVLRHFDIPADGIELYKNMPCRMKDGSVLPKGIIKLFAQYGFKAKYHAGSINALKNEVSKGAPVIVLVRTHPDKNWLHYIPVVGFDKEHIFIAESLAELVNCAEEHYNRSLTNRQFRRLWNTSMLKMPLYRNTFISIRK